MPITKEDGCLFVLGWYECCEEVRKQNRVLFMFGIKIDLWTGNREDSKLKLLTSCNRLKNSTNQV